MSWFKIDDAFWAHPKILKLSADAIALWTRAGSWCSQQLTDGEVESHVLPMFLATPDAVAELVSAGLWHIPGDRCEDCEEVRAIPESGYLFHDWLKYQRSREEVQAEREANRQRQKRARDRARERREVSERPESVSNDSPDGSGHAERHAVTHVTHNGPPDPTRPDPTEVTTDVVTSSAGASAGYEKRRGTRIPDEFFLTDRMKEWHAEKWPAVDIRLETEKFVNFFRAKSGRDAIKLDWEATWRNWIINAGQRLPQSSTAATAKPTKTERARGVLEMGARRQAARDGRTERPELES